MKMCVFYPSTKTSSLFLNHWKKTCGVFSMSSIAWLLFVISFIAKHIWPACLMQCLIHPSGALSKGFLFPDQRWSKIGKPQRHNSLECCHNKIMQNECNTDIIVFLSRNKPVLWKKGGKCNKQHWSWNILTAMKSQDISIPTSWHKKFMWQGLSA